MANLPPSLSVNLNPAFGGPSPPSPSSAGPAAHASRDRRLASAEQLVLDLCDPELRENALLDLSKVPSFCPPSPLIFYVIGKVRFFFLI